MNCIDDLAICNLEETVVCCGLNTVIQQGEASDVIIVWNGANHATAACSDFIVQFSKIQESNNNSNNNNKTFRITIAINGSLCHEMNMKITEKGCRFCTGESLKPPAHALQTLFKYIVPGKNSMRYSLINRNNQVIGQAEASLFLWNVHSHIIVCDIDGTITKSNARGVLDTMVLESYAYAHEGVCEFLSHLEKLHESLQILYLTSRPISYAQTTRRFLDGLRQDEQHALPQGPLFLHPGTLGTVLFSELVSKDAHTYKHDTLMRQVVLVFAAAGRESTDKLLISGFGNALTDSVAYEMAGISRDNIYMIDKKSQISCMNKSMDSIADHIKINSQGSLVLDESEREEQAVSSRREILTSQKSSRQQRKSLHRQYTQLIGSSYNGYHDESLLEDVSRKIQESLELQ